MLSELQPICLLIALMFGGLFVVAGVSKFRDIYRARNWVATTGRVTESKVRSQRNTWSDTHEFESLPLVVYECAVGGKNYRGTKINFAEKISGEDVAPMLKKYPVGKVVTVYYNPARPAEAVLERELPPLLFIGVGAIIVVILGLGLGMPFVYEFAARGVEKIAPHALNAGMATMLCGMGGVALWMALAIYYQVWAARNWQTTPGKILDTSVQARDSWDSDGRYTPLYNSEVVYSFTVGGEQYISDRVALGGTMRASVNGRAPGFIAAGLRKYPKGASVTVYYNPKNPSECVLERRANGLAFVLFVATVFLGMAAWMLGVFAK